MKLSVVVPYHNEEGNIPLILEKFARVYAQQPLELILVNNASTDGTGRVLEDALQKKEYAFVRVVDEPIPGYGRAILTGLRAAKGDVLSWTHADLQTDPADVLRAFELFKKHPNPDQIVVKGKRIQRSFGQSAFTFCMSLIASVILRGRYFDINAQPKMFSRRFFEREFRDPPNDFSLDLYLLVRAKKSDARIVTFPVVFAKRLHGQSKWAFSFRSKWKTILRTIRYIFILRHTIARENS